MNRRGFLGFLGAGAAAAPKLATSLAEEAARGGSMALPPMGGGLSAVDSASDAGWRAERISRLKAIISGKDPNTKRERTMRNLYMAEDMERFRLDGLRSISATHKMRMFIDGAVERAERIRKQDAEFDLAEMLREKLPF